MKKNKSIITEENFFSYLRSLGFLFPQSEKEIERFEKLHSDYVHELDGKEISPEEIIQKVKGEEKIKGNITPIGTKTTKANLYFKRVALAAEIASQLYNEPTFGHVKFQKLVYLCEQAGNLRLPERYSKQVAGPYDRKFMHSIDNELKKQKWFNVTQEGPYNKYTYTPSENLSKYKVYYNRYFSACDNQIQWIIETFRNEKTDFVELIATLYACWEEILRKKEVFSERLVIKNFYDWSSAKSKFKKDDVKEALKWMEEKSLIPQK